MCLLYRTTPCLGQVLFWIVEKGKRIPTNIAGALKCWIYVQCLNVWLCYGYNIWSWFWHIIGKQKELHLTQMVTYDMVKCTPPASFTKKSLLSSCSPKADHYILAENGKKIKKKRNKSPYLPHIPTSNPWHTWTQTMRWMYYYLMQNCCSLINVISCMKWNVAFEQGILLLVPLCPMYDHYCSPAQEIDG